MFAPSLLGLLDHAPGAGQSVSHVLTLRGTGTMGSFNAQARYEKTGLDTSCATSAAPEFSVGVHNARK